MHTLPQKFDAVFSPLEVLLLFALAKSAMVRQNERWNLTEHFNQHHFVATSCTKYCQVYHRLNGAVQNKRLRQAH